MTTNVFGGNTIPPARNSYAAVTLTANATWIWPYNYSGASQTVAKLMDVSLAAPYTVTMPDATQVSQGEDLLIRNVGSATITLNKADGTALATVAAGAAQYLYLSDVTTTGGTWGSVAFGVGTASLNAASLVGYGIIAIGASLNTATPVFNVSSSIMIDGTYRAGLVNFTGGALSLTITAAATLGSNWFASFHNSGTGTLTLAPAAGTIDGAATFMIQPGESLTLITDGANFFTVGYGRSTVYQFTQLVLDVTAGGTFTLSAAQAANKLLTFTGSPAAGVTVVVPNVVSVYYVQNALSTAQSITLKTAAGTGIGIAQSIRIVAICDGVNVYSAASPTVGNASVSLIDGSAAAPSLNFSSSTNTGLYKDATPGIGFAVSGASVGRMTATGLNAMAVGTTTPAAGSFTTLAASGAVSGAGITALFASPPAIGGTAAAAGSFTTLGASGAVTLSPANAAVTLSPTGTGTVTINPATAGTINNVSIGATTATTGKFTTLQATGLVSANLGLAVTGAAFTSRGITDNATATAVTIDASGNEAIGTTVNNVFDAIAAARPLLVQKADTSTTLIGSTASITICNSDTTTGNSAQINFATGTGASTNQYTGAAISAVFTTARVNGQYSPADIVFSTSAATNFGPAERFRITAAGNVTQSTSVNGMLQFQINNSNAGAAAETDIYVISNAGNVRIQKVSTALGAYGQIVSSGGYLNVGTGDAQALNLNTNSATRIGVAAAGNVTINAPTSGNTLTVSAVAGTHSTKIADSANTSYNAGYLELPVNGQGTPYTAVLADAGKCLYYSATGAAAFTIPANASVAYPIGTTLTFVNDATGATNMTIAITTDTLVLSPGGTTGSRTLAQFGRATAHKVTATRWIISGTGLT